MGTSRLLALGVALWVVSACGSDETSSSSGGSGGVAGTHHAAGSAGTAGGSVDGGGGATGGSAGELATGGGAGVGGSAGSASVVCDLGTMYPGVPLIDPDAPVYQDASWTQQAVTDAFAQAKAESSTAYLGYKAARDYAQYLDCAFCACGCAPSIGHLSAIDCFKDMHGFT